MTTKPYSVRDRVVGAYMGAAAGDALGGPIEGWHAGMIKAAHGKVERFLPYTRPLRPGYALHAEPGAVTDDTYIRNDFAAYVLTFAKEKDRTPEVLARWLLKNAHFEWWWPPAVKVLRKVEAGEPFEKTRAVLMGGGAAWWTPFGLVHAGDPAAAYGETERHAIIWRLPFEQNLIAATQAGVAASVTDGATVESVSETVMTYAGPLARKLLGRAQRIAKEHDGDLDGFVRAIYAECLVTECTGEIDGPMPKAAVASDPYRGATVLWAEQIPLAFAAFTHGKGDFMNTMVSCASLGRDTDSIASTCGSWIGGLVGLKGMPADWVNAMQTVNSKEMDLLGIANKMADAARA